MINTTTQTMQRVEPLPNHPNTDKQGCSQSPESKTSQQEFAAIMETLNQQNQD